MPAKRGMKKISKLAKVKDAKPKKLAIKKISIAGKKPEKISANTGFSQSSVANAYDQIARKWDEAHTRPRNDFHFLTDYIRKVQPYSGTILPIRVLDAGCGNGCNTSAFFSRFGNAQIECLDLSTGMLSVASRKLSGMLLHKVRFRKGTITNIQYPVCYFDLVMCLAAFHHLGSERERIVALREFLRILKPGGIAFISVWAGRPASFAGKDETIAFPTLSGEPIGRNYHFFGKPELEALSKQAGFAIVDSFYEDGGIKIPQSKESKTRNLCVILKKR